MERQYPFNVVPTICVNPNRDHLPKILAWMLIWVHPNTPNFKDIIYGETHRQISGLRNFQRCSIFDQAITKWWTEIHFYKEINIIIYSKR